MKSVEVECVQTDNGFERTNRFPNSKRDIPTLFEETAAAPAFVTSSFVHMRYAG